jgi:histidyl-tRNA synthetase
MSGKKYTAVRGTRDILPSQSKTWENLKSEARNIFELYGYSEIITPTFEKTELFKRSIGESTEIVQKEMYTFLDKKGRSLTLRPEGTAGAVRVYLERNLNLLAQLVKVYYVGQMFRYERPQTGRYREFWQLGVEAFGSDDPALDAENIIMLVDYLKNVGLSEMDVLINSMGCKNCRPAYLKTLRQFLGRGEMLCDDCRERAVLNPLRAFDCKTGTCVSYLDSAPKINEYLCSTCVSDFNAVKSYLDDVSLIYRVKPALVRGFDYYTKTTFEVQVSSLGSQNAVAGGGRYDYLVEEFGGKPTPAVGFAIGLERLFIAVNQPESSVETDIFVAFIGDESKKEAFKALCLLRRHGVKSEMDFLGKSIKGQLKLASKFNAKRTIIIGPEEMETGNLKVKDMESGFEKIINKGKLLKEIKVE